MKEQLKETLQLSGALFYGLMCFLIVAAIIYEVAR